MIENPNKPKKFIHVNSAKVKDIRWDLMKQENISRMIPYEKYLKESHYSEEYLKEKFPTEKSYIDYETNFTTYAVLTPDGKWYEPGTMGWWGISNATAEEERDFSQKYEEEFIKNVNPEWRLTIVDCHI